MTRTPRLAALLAFVVCLVCLLGTAPAASAATFTVTRTGDRASGACAPGDCSLREAIIAANQNAGADQIVLGTAQVYALTLGPADVTPTSLTPESGDLDITDSVVIAGNGSTIDATGLADRVVQIDGAVVTINDLTITGGVVAGTLSLGGGIYAHASSVTLNNCLVTANSTLVEAGASDDGGGIAVLGTFTSGSATMAQLTLDHTSVTNNSGLNGGGLVCVLCDLVVRNGSVISGNAASGTDGGGLDVLGDASTVSVTQTAIVSNTAARGGGLALPVGTSTSTLSFNRIVSNTGGTTGAIYTSSGTVIAQNNWWGCNFGPGQTGSDCAAAANAVSAGVSATPYLVLKASASPASVQKTAATTATADLTFNSSDTDTSGLGFLPNATAISFAGSGGNFTTPTVGTTSGKASDVFTTTASGSLALSAALDGQTAPFALLVNTPPTVSQIAAQTTDEDTAIGPIGFTVGDDDGNALTISGGSSDPALVSAIVFGGNGSSRTITITPAANTPATTASAVTTITINVNDGFVTTPMSFLLTVNAVNDAPTLNTLASPAAIGENAGQQTIALAGITAGGGENQTLSVTATSDNHALLADPAVAYSSPNASGSLSYTPVANAFGTATITVRVADDGGTANGGVDAITRTFTVTVDPVANTPSFSAAATTEDTQTTSGLVLTRNAADGAEVTHYKITAISGGTLFQHDGTTPIVGGSFITVAQGAAGLRFTPSADSVATGHVTAQASIGALDAGLGGSPVTADITVTPVADTPVVTGATTPEDTQTANGLVLSRNAADGTEVTHFKITAIANGSLFQHDGTTPIANGDVITFAQGNAGLRFTPSANFSGTGSFGVQAATSAAGDGLSPTTTASITVTAVADTPSITGTSTVVNQQTTSGLVISRNAADGVEVTHVKVTAVSGGTLFQNDGTAPIAAGSFITVAQGAAGLKFTPTANSVATGHVSIQASTSNIDAGLGGGVATADVIVSQLTSTTTVVTSLSPSNAGEAVTFTATVTPTLAGATGTVQFRDGAADLGAPVTLVGGTAALTTSALTPGAHAITAVYGGNSLATGSTGTLAGGQIVRAGVTVVLTPSANPSPLGSPVTIQVTPAPAGGGTATGFVLFRDNLTPLAELVLNNGTTSFTTSSLSLGTHHLVADYAGDVTFAAASGSVDLTIVCPTMTIGPATIPAVLTGLSYSQTFTVTGVGPGTPTFALTGMLPVGLTFNPATATLSGAAVAPGSYPITITVTRDNGCGAASQNYTLVVAGGRTILTGADAGGSPQLRRFTALDGSDPASGAASFLAFDALFSGGVRVAEGDINGDGKPDFIAGSGPGRPAEVRIFDGASGALIRTITMFEPDFTGGVYVAAGDVDADGFADVIVGSGAGRAGEVRVYSGRTGGLLRDAMVFVGGFTGGVRVAAGDTDGDGFAEVVVGMGPGGADVAVLSSTSMLPQGFLTPYPGFTGGVFVAVGDVNGDGYADVVTGADGGGSPLVRVFDGRTGLPLLALMPFDAAFTGGVRVAAGDLTGDGHAEIIAGRGPGGSADVRVFDGVTAAPLNAVSPYPVSFMGGVFVATAVPLSRMSIDTPASAGSVRSNFTIAGWAFEEGTTGVGIAAIDATAFPVDGSSPIILGTATLGDARPDVAAAFGAQYAASGFHLSVSGLSPGTYDLRVTARCCSATRVPTLFRSVRVTVRPDPVPLLSIDVPAGGPVAGGDFTLAGWALTPESPTPPGVDAVHVWAAPVTGGAWRFAGAAVLGLPRLDVAALFGFQYVTAGYALTITGLPAGTWDLHVYARETGKSSFAAERVVRVTVPGGPARTVITGADVGGGPHVRRLSALDGSPAPGVLNSFFAFDPSFAGGVRVAEGDLNGDGVTDYIIGAGPGGSPDVRVIDGASGTVRTVITAFESSFRGGVYVAAGDLNGDGYADIIVGSGQGRAGEIKAWNGRDLSLYADMPVFDPTFTGGARVAAGDVNGDGYADVVAGTGTGASLVTVISAATGATLRTFTAYPGFGGGVFVAAADVNGDGFADIVTGAGEGGGPLVRVFDGRSNADVIAFYAFAPSFTGGVRVAAGDVTGDGRADVIAGSGPGGGDVRVFDGSTAALLNTMTPYSGFAGGVFVATAVPLNRMSIDLPAMNATVAPSFALGGWAFIDGPGDAGLDAIHVWAMPVGGGAPIFAGVATLGDARPDVALVFGPQYGHAGYHLTVSALPAGTYDLMVFGHGTKTQTFSLQRVVRVKVGQ